ncbi:hypothetical protein SEA_DARTHPHADER_84 [Mycobacterium phage DarthPhader]|uniref:DUF2786 domain-containing protein n=1 Tax=Mycobacterium phage DarthPhader TaxID=1912975 RepID=A0A1I9S430_9CAUD|nr:hypothetical protein KIV60_gp17 [Mycobacterium phage DarthPhader]AOZ61324.1 hypothetical protein SEA_DARTHPHADER_84 [Mycobacterium phage DarthPhader]
MTSKREKMQTVVAKLLRQAEDTAGTPEGDIFQAKAFEVMAKYGIEQAQVDAAARGMDNSAIPNAERWSWTFRGKYVAQQALLLNNIVVALHGKAVISTSRHTREQTLIVFAVPRHLERIKFLWDILHPQMLRLVETVRPAEAMYAGMTYDYRTGSYKKKSTAGQLKSYRRGWIAGFGNAVGERIRTEEAKALEGAGGALVLYRDDKARAEVALREAFPRMGRARTSRIDPSGYAHGQRDGRTASFNRSIA